MELLLTVLKEREDAKRNEERKKERKREPSNWALQS
jgi:hypothetical protein